ncbi:MAG: macro domain-containing protein [Desulfovibrio sp.]|nr:macro domain-containing protein [Desulfovibrio sp.]
MPLKIVRNDITEMRVDAIVNTANPRPIVGGGVDYAIHSKAGPELLKARQEIGDIDRGKAAITPAYHLHARHVIHAVGPRWKGGNQGEREVLASCYEHSLQLAVEHACSSIAFPLISAGLYGCPPEIAIVTATQAIRAFLRNHELDVYLVVFNRDCFTISTTLFNDVRNYIDDRFVEKRLMEEFRMDARHYRQTRGLPVETCLEKYPVRRSRPNPKAPSLEASLNRIGESFSQKLLALLESKGKTGAEVYKRANVDAKHFSKIRNNPDYHPSKATALAFAVALKLNIDETKDFIGRAGYALSQSNKADIIVEYFIKRGEYDIYTINETLFTFGQPLLGR